jgi:hypothetical protein
LKAVTIASVLLPFEHLDHFIQVGDDATCMHLLAIGRKQGEVR